MSNTKLFLRITYWFIFIVTALTSFEDCSNKAKGFVENLPPAAKPILKGSGVTLKGASGKKYTTGSLNRCGDRYLLGKETKQGRGEDWHRFYLKVKYPALSNLTITYNGILAEKLDPTYPNKTAAGPVLWTTNRLNSVRTTSKVYYWFVSEELNDEYMATIAIVLGQKNKLFGELKLWTESLNPNHTGLEKESEPLILKTLTVHPFESPIKLFNSPKKEVLERRSFILKWNTNYADQVQINGHGFRGWESVSPTGSISLMAPCLSKRNSNELLYQIRTNFNNCINAQRVSNFKIKIKEENQIEFFRKAKVPLTVIEETPFTLEWKVPRAISINISGDGINSAQNFPNSGRIKVTPTKIKTSNLQQGELRHYILTANFQK